MGNCSVENVSMSIKFLVIGKELNLKPGTYSIRQSIRLCTLPFQKIIDIASVESNSGSGVPRMLCRLII